MGWCECHDPWLQGQAYDHMSKAEIKCPICETLLIDAVGIGPYCPNPNCPVLDDALLWKKDDTGKIFFRKTIEMEWEKIDWWEEWCPYVPIPELTKEEWEKIKQDWKKFRGGI